MHVWCNQSGITRAAFVITNTGGRDAVIGKITVRGVKATSIYYKVVTSMTDPQYASNSSKLQSGYTSLGTGKSLGLPSGQQMVIYLFNLTHISTSDIGVPISVVVFTANAQYYKEANVEAYIE